MRNIVCGTYTGTFAGYKHLQDKSNKICIYDGIRIK